MAVYIAFIATLNLCLGYALGVYFGVMPGITPRNRLDLDEEEPIGLPTTPSKALPQAVSPGSSETTPIPAEELPAKAVSQVSHDPKAESDLESDVDPTNILEGLATFRAKLDSANAKIKAANENRQELDACATELKQANTEYLETAHDTLDSLNESNTTTEEHLQLQATLAKQSAEVEQANQDIEELLTEQDTGVVREKLLESTDQLSESAGQVEQAIPQTEEKSSRTNSQAAEVQAASEDPTKTNRERPAQLGSIDQLLDEVDRSISKHGAAALLQVGAVAVEGMNSFSGQQVEQLLMGLEHLVAAQLAEEQSLAVDEANRLMVLLPGDDRDTANERCERVRQQIAATTFAASDEQLQVTASCAVAEVGGAASHEEVLARVNDALEQAQKRGGSSTVHHDGTEILPVPAMELNIEAVKVAI